MRFSGIWFQLADFYGTVSSERRAEDKCLFSRYRLLRVQCSGQQRLSLKIQQHSLIAGKEYFAALFRWSCPLPFFHSAPCPLSITGCSHGLRPEAGDRFLLIFLLTLSFVSYPLHFCMRCNDRGRTRQRGTLILPQMHVSTYSSSGLYWGGFFTPGSEKYPFLFCFSLTLLVHVTATQHSYTQDADLSRDIFKLERPVSILLNSSFPKNGIISEGLKMS